MPLTHLDTGLLVGSWEVMDRARRPGAADHVPGSGGSCLGARMGHPPAGLRVLC